MLRSSRLILLFAGLAAACCTGAPAADTTASADASTAPSQLRPLRLGMAMDEVRALWGEPESARNLRTPYRERIVQWTYSRVVDSRAKPMEIRLVDQPAFDPFDNQNGFLRNVRAPVITPTWIDRIAGVQLVFKDGILAASKPFTSERQRFAN